MIRFPSRTAGLAALALVAKAPAQAEILAPTDASWLGSAGAAGAGRNGSAAYNAASWRAETVLLDVATNRGPSYCAYGNWSSGGQYSTTESTIWAAALAILSLAVASLVLV